MQDHDLRLLYINSDVDALISINHIPIGQTGASAISQPIANDTDFFVSMQPLNFEPGLAYIPYTRRISIGGSGNIFSNDGLVRLCFWPDRIAELKLEPLSVYKNQLGEIIPGVISPFEFFISGERHTAFIYNEAGSSFAVEHSTTNRLKYIYPLPFYVTTADITLVKLGDYPVLYASGKTANGKTYFAAVGILPTFRKQICTYCDSYDIGSGSISVVTDEPFGQRKTTYAVKDGSLDIVDTQLGWFTKDTRQPTTNQQVCEALLLAMKTSNSETALACLTSELKEGLSFPDLADFFGNFETSSKALMPSSEGYSFALLYRQSENIYRARVFAVETKDSHGRKLIDNITEL